MSGSGALELRVSETDEDAAEIDRLTRQLRRQLEELDVESVEHVVEGPPPEGAKAVEALVLGKLVVRYGPGALRMVVGTVQRWTARDEGREVTFEYGDLKLHLKGATAESQQQAMDEFIRAVEAKRGA
jgi:hypothetical protein